MNAYLPRLDCPPDPDVFSLLTLQHILWESHIDFDSFAFVDTSSL